jgi:hypothetical protein
MEKYICRVQNSVHVHRSNNIFYIHHTRSNKLLMNNIVIDNTFYSFNHHVTSNFEEQYIRSIVIIKLLKAVHIRVHIL